MLESVYPNIEKANSWETVTKDLITKIVSSNVHFNNQYLQAQTCTGQADFFVANVDQCKEGDASETEAYGSGNKRYSKFKL